MLRAFLPHWKRLLLPPIFLAALTFALFWEVIGGGRQLFFGDLGLYFVPLLSIQRETLLTGRLALWNPTLLCGTPLWGNPQAFPLYPSSLLLFLMPASQAVGIIAAFHGWLASWGTFLFLRRRGVSQSAALFGAVAWGMGGAVVSKAQFPNMSQACAFLPFLLLGVEGVVRTPRPERAAWLGAAVGLALLAAHPQIFLMQFYVCAAWAVFRLRGEKNKRATLGFLIGGVLLGLGLAAGQLLPCVELVRDSVRTHLTITQANRFVLPLYAALTNFVAPNFYGNPATNADYVGRGNFWEPCAFLGIVPFGFALWGGIRLFRAANADVRFWAVVALLGVGLALGKEGGLWAIAFNIVPGVSKFHDAARWLYVGTWGLACCAAWGMDAFLKTQAGAPVRRRLWAAGLILAAAWQVVGFGRTLNPTVPASVWGKLNKGANPNGGAERTYFVDEHRAWARWVSYRTYRVFQNDDEAARFLSSQTPNTNVFNGQKQAGGYEPVRRTNINRLLIELQKQGGEKQEEKVDGAVQAAMGITSITRLGPTFAPETRFIPGARGRAVLAQRWQAVSTSEAALQSLTTPSANADVPLICGLPEPIAANVLGAPPPIPLRVVDVSPQRVVVWLPPKHPAGVVVLADTLHPGWTTRVDGGPAVVPLLANGVFRAVPIEKNDKQVEFLYDPASVRVGVFISLSAAGILTAIALGQYCRFKKEVRGGKRRGRFLLRGTPPCSDRTGTQTYQGADTK